jgi:hypothetical protein
MDIGQRGFDGAIVAPGAERPQEASCVTRIHAGRIDWFDKGDQDVIGLATGVALPEERCWFHHRPRVQKSKACPDSSRQTTHFAISVDGIPAPFALGDTSIGDRIIFPV